MQQQLTSRAGRFASWILEGGFREIFQETGSFGLEMTCFSLGISTSRLQELSSSWSGMNGAEQVPPADAFVKRNRNDLFGITVSRYHGLSPCIQLVLLLGNMSILVFILAHD